MRQHTTASGKIVHTGGRHRPLVTPSSHPHLFKSVRRYMAGSSATLPTAPDTFDYFAPVPAETDILGNDVLGDCTAAGACHLVESYTNAGGAPVVLQRADAVNFYSLSTGYNPADPSTDQGGDEVSVCTYWRDHGLDGKGSHAIAGWLSVDATDWALVKSCLWLFGGGYTGLELDASWPSTAAPGAIWDQGTPDPEEGHCVVFGGAQGTMGKLNTWGILMFMTQGAIAKFMCEAAGGNFFVPVSKEIVAAASGKAPTGLDWASLITDFDGLGGAIPAPPSTKSSDQLADVVPKLTPEDVRRILAREAPAALKLLEEIGRTNAEMVSRSMSLRLD